MTSESLPSLSVRSMLAKPLGLLASAWVVGVQLYYVVTLDSDGFRKLLYTLFEESFSLGIVFLSFQFVLIPLALLFGFRAVQHRVHSRAWRGAIAGLVYGMWGSATLILVPILGTYPTLPTIMIVMETMESFSPFSTKVLNILAANALVYPLFGAILYCRKQLPYPPGCCKTCGYNLTGNVSGVCPECGIEVNG